MGKKSGPAAPDYTAAAEKTAQSNKEATTAQTWANRADQTDPWGSLKWSSYVDTDPATGQQVTKWKQTTELDPRLQSALDSQIAVQQGQSDIAQGLLGRVRDEYSSPMDWGQLQDWAGVPQAGNLQPTTFNFGGISPQNIDTSRAGTPQLQSSLNFGGVQNVQGSDQSRQRAENAIYQSATSRLDPQWQQQQSQMEAKLANQGITQGSAAYQQAMDNFNRQKTDAYQQASMGAITGGGAEAQRNQAMDLGLRQQQVGEIGQQGQFANQAMAQGFGFGQQAREQELAAQQALYQQQLGAGQYGLQGQQQQFQQQSAANAQNFQQQLQASNYANQLRQQQLTEAQQRRGFSLNEIQALLNGQQVSTPQFQNYSQAGNWGGTDYSGAAQQQYGAAMDAANAQQAGKAGTMQGIASVGMAAATMF